MLGSVVPVARLTVNREKVTIGPKRSRLCVVPWGPASVCAIAAYRGYICIFLHNIYFLPLCEASSCISSTTNSTTTPASTPEPATTADAHPHVIAPRFGFDLSARDYRGLLTLLRLMKC